MKKKVKVQVPRAVQEPEEEDSEVENSDIDTDDELATAFQEGRLEPGLNVIVPYKKKIVVNNVTGLKVKLDELKQDDLEWVERLDVTCEPLEVTPAMIEQFGDIDVEKNKSGGLKGVSEDDAQNDFKREMYLQAQAALSLALPKLKKLGVKTKRPEDYFAQMLKTDTHMAKVQDNLNSKREALEKSEKAKKMREMKKMGKKIQQEVLLTRQKEKREMLDKVKAYKKGKIKSLDFDADKKPKKGILKNGKPTKVTKKRMKKNETYGFGGQKKRGKANNAESFNSDFTSKSGKMKGRPGGKKSAPQRPGKQRRQNIRKGR